MLSCVILVPLLRLFCCALEVHLRKGASLVLQVLTGTSTLTPGCSLTVSNAALLPRLLQVSLQTMTFSYCDPCGCCCERLLYVAGLNLAQSCLRKEEPAEWKGCLGSCRQHKDLLWQVRTRRSSSAFSQSIQIKNSTN